MPDKKSARGRLRLRSGAVPSFCHGVRAVLDDERFVPFSLGGSWDLPLRACASALFALLPEPDGEPGLNILRLTEQIIKNGETPSSRS